MMIYHLKPNGLVYPYQQDKIISNFRGVGFFSSNFNRTSCKPTSEDCDQTIQSVVFDMGCMFCFSP